MEIEKQKQLAQMQQRSVLDKERLERENREVSFPALIWLGVLWGSSEGWDGGEVVPQAPVPAVRCSLRFVHTFAESVVSGEGGNPTV